MNRKIQKEPKTFLQFQLVLRMPSSTEIFADKPAQLTGVPISELMLNIQVAKFQRGFDFIVLSVLLFPYLTAKLEATHDLGREIMSHTLR